jgi:hypothetical protein
MAIFEFLLNLKKICLKFRLHSSEICVVYCPIPPTPPSKGQSKRNVKKICINRIFTCWPLIFKVCMSWPILPLPFILMDTSLVFSLFNIAFAFSLCVIRKNIYPFGAFFQQKEGVNFYICYNLWNIIDFFPYQMDKRLLIVHDFFWVNSETICCESEEDIRGFSRKKFYSKFL